MKKRSFTLLMSALTISATLIGTSPVAAKTDTDTATEETTDKEETTAKDADSENTDNKETDASKSDTLEDGTYTAEFDTDSGMFHVNEANDGKGTLTVKDGKMTIHVSLASKKIVNLFVGKAEEVLPRYYENYKQEHGGEKAYADVIVVDPPRKGCDETLLATMVQMQPERIVYVSCDSATLARDLKYLCENGYELKKVRAVDMFPNTVHVETVCLLSKLHANQHIEVELQMDEFDLTATESKATYEEIKEYVLKQSGLKVSNLYIAQVKQKCGIIERENYNLPKSENSRQPKCPPEKEAAIREALEHFRMI